MQQVRASWAVPLPVGVVSVVVRLAQQLTQMVEEHPMKLEGFELVAVAEVR